jgi:hypothetical protein
MNWSRSKFVVLVCIAGIVNFSCVEQQKLGHTEGDSVNPRSWETLSESSLGFTAKFPGQWQHQVQFMETESGAATVHIFEYGDVAFQYGITVVRFPPGESDMSDPDLVLDYSVSSLVEETGGVISYQENLEVGGYPARRAIISLPESFLKNARLNTLIVLRGSLVYRASTSGIGNLEFTEFFLESFDITPISLM